MQLRHRLILALVLATFVLGMNAYAVVHGWSPFEVPDSNFLSTIHVHPGSMLTDSLGEAMH